MTAFTDAVVRICRAELATFHNGRLKEIDEAVFRRVGDYWNELATHPGSEEWAGYNGRSDCTFDASGRLIKNKNKPWSAAFISFVAAKAGAGGNFRYGASHSVYIVRALRQASNPSSTDKFIARRHTQYAPKVGDLIACERRCDTDVEQPGSHRRPGSELSHCQGYLHHRAPAVRRIDSKQRRMQ